MSAIQSNRARVEVDGPAVARACETRLTLRWAISADAAAGAGLAGPGATDIQLELVLVVATRDGHSRAVVSAARVIHRNGADDLDAVRGSGACITDAETGLTHIDLPGLLHLSYQADVLLYARTPLLADLGIGGGRYERPTMVLDLTGTGSLPQRDASSPRP